MVTTVNAPVGALLRQWREHRHLSQLDLSIKADISTRHLSFVETGRSKPTKNMIIRLSEQLDIPLRERNTVLLAGGYAPAYPHHDFAGPELAAVREAMRDIVRRHDPYPAVVIDRWWDLVEGNAALGRIAAVADPRLLEAPVNVLRLSLHPDGLASRIRNLPEWRAHLLGQVRRRAAATGDPRLGELYEELLGYPGGLSEIPSPAQVVLPMRFDAGGQELNLFSIDAAVANPVDVTVQELTVELFYPADDTTAAILRGAA